MSSLVIEGGYPLCGVVEVQGAKNSILPILAATLLTDGDCIIENCPDISDKETAIEILSAIGAQTIAHDKYLLINTKYAEGYVIPDALMRKMRSSIIFLGAMLSKRGRARVSFPGGCDIGTRPIDLHIAAFKKMGVKISEEYGFLDCECDQLTGAEINLSFPSVGATENIILAAVKAEGTTVICNAAKEPEIVDLQGFINSMGGKIKGAGTATIIIEGVSKLHGTKYSVISDRIVAATYICAIAATRGNALIKNIVPEHLSAVISVLTEAGCVFKPYENMISVECDKIRGIKTDNVVRTMPYPGFPTDIGSPFVALMSIGNGTTVFVETIFENRFKYVGELLRMGAKIRTEGRVAVIDGVERLYGTSVIAHDLRGGAAMVVAGLAAEGETVIKNAEYIERGYERIDENLKDLGARIKLER